MIKIFAAALFGLLFVSVLCAGQSVPVTLQTESVKNLRTEQTGIYVCLFKIYPNDRVEWVQGDFVQSFPITSTEGNFPAEEPGRITYNLIKEGNSGKVIVERKSDSVSLTLDLTEDMELGAFFTFQISNQ